MNRRELNNLIKEELEAAVKGHPSYLEEAEDMEAGDMEGGEGDDHEELMDSLQGFYEKLKAHFEGEEGGEEKTEEEEEAMETEEEDPEEVEEGKKKKAPKDKKEKEDEEENTLNESVKRFQKLANIRG
jgi:hypothetical protein